MYALHFFYGVGALLTPIIAKPFLRDQAEFSLNTTLLNTEELEQGNNQIWTIKTLYPLISLIMLLPSPLFIHYFIQDRRKEKRFHKSSSNVTPHQEASCNYLSRNRVLLLMVFAVIYYFTLSGIEHGFRSFTAVFSVNSKLALTRPEAADVLATFYVAFAAVRGLMIPLSTLVSAPAVLWSSSALLLASTALLSVWGQSSIQARLNI